MYRTVTKSHPELFIINYILRLNNETFIKIVLARSLVDRENDEMIFPSHKLTNDVIHTSITPSAFGIRIT